jgi:hypothetical protein
MSRTFHHGERRIRVRGVRKDPPDLRRLARALIELAELQADAQAAAQHERQQRRESRQRAKATREDAADDGDAA